MTGNLNEGCFYYPATLLPNGKVLVEGGDGLSGERSSAELDVLATGTWTLTGGLQRRTPIAFSDVAARWQGACGRRVYGFIVSSVELYDPATGIWTVGNGLSVARFTHTATLLRNGKVLVAGGFGGSGTLASSESWETIRRPETGQILEPTPHALLTRQRSCATAESWLQVELTATAFPRVRRCIIQTAGPGPSSVASTTHATRTPQPCFATAWCLWLEDLDNNGELLKRRTV